MQLGEQANDQAKLTDRKHSSCLDREKKTKRSHNSSAFRELDEATVRRYLLNSLGFIGFCAVVTLEWFVQSPVYRSETKYGILLYLSLAAMCWFAAVCIGQIFPDYRIRFGQLPGHTPESASPTKLSWWKKWWSQRSPFHPVIGVILFVGVEMFVLTLSGRRVDYEQTINASAMDTTVLPVFLYLAELIFGIPAYWFFEWVIVKALKRWDNRQLSKAKLTYDQSANKARALWNRCLAAEAEYNHYARQHGLPEHMPIRQNRYLVKLLHEEYGLADQAQAAEQPATDQRVGDRTEALGRLDVDPNNSSNNDGVEKE